MFLYVSGNGKLNLTTRHLVKLLVRFYLPTSVAHVTSHLTISRRRQFKVDSVIRITYKNRMTKFGWKIILSQWENKTIHSRYKLLSILPMTRKVIWSKALHMNLDLSTAPLAGHAPAWEAGSPSGSTDQMGPLNTVHAFFSSPALTFHGSDLEP